MREDLPSSPLEEALDQVVSGLEENQRLIDAGTTTLREAIDEATQTVGREIQWASGQVAQLRRQLSLANLLLFVVAVFLGLITWRVW